MSPACDWLCPRRQDCRNVQSLAFGPDGRLFGAGEGDAFPYNDFLAVIDPASRARTIITSDLQGMDNIRGIVFVPEPGMMALMTWAALTVYLKPLRRWRL